VTGEPWRYRCSLCGATIRPDDVAAHTTEEKAKPTWPGFMTWTRVDDPPEPDEAVS